MRLVRIMVFYDGYYFKNGYFYFRYREERGWIKFPELHALFEEFVTEKLNTTPNLTKVVGAHYYDGRTPAQAAEPIHLKNDRIFEMILLGAGITPHYLPIKEIDHGRGGDSRRHPLFAQKGVDVDLALDVLDYAHDDRFDVAVVVSGDGDFVPLVRKITSLSKQTLVAHFNYDYVDESDIRRSSFCARDLQNVATWALNFNTIVEDRRWSDHIDTLFAKPNMENSNHHAR